MTRWIERLLLCVAVVGLGYGTRDQLEASIYQFVQGRRLDALLTRSGADELTRPAGKTIGSRQPGLDPEGLIGRIEIKRVGLSAIVAEGVDRRTLRHAVGHIPATAMPGDAGNIVLAGHRDSFFRRLKDVRVGDRVTLRTPDGLFTYDIDSTDVVGPERVDLLEPSEASTLTLITCYPFHFVGPAPDRFIVRARPAG